MRKKQDIALFIYFLRQKGVSNGVYFVIPNSSFLTFLKLTLKFEPLDIGDILSMNLFRVCMLLHLP